MYAHSVYAESLQKSPLFDNLGSLNHPISSKIPLAQRFFNQGLVFFYGFEWSESVRSFQESVRLDPNCGICHWGLALALGSKANAPMIGHEYTDAQAAIKKAIALTLNGTDSEKSLIHALSIRLRHDQAKTEEMRSFSCHFTAAELSSSQKDLLDYSEEMRRVVEKFPKDNDIMVLYAYSLFDLIEWKFWDEDKKINSRTPILLAALEKVLRRDKMHPGANHYYVHVIEQSPNPGKALEIADRIGTLVPGSEHLVHMPAHIYFLLGRYHDGTIANLNAIEAYKNYSKICRAQGFEAETTYLYHHDLDFLRSSATVEGRRQLALSAAQQLVENTPASWIQKDSSLQGFWTVPYFVKARFGMWTEILKETAPDPKFTYLSGIWHYSRGMALAHTGNLEESKKEATELAAIIRNNPWKRKGATIAESHFNLLRIGNEVLGATLANLQGDESATLSHLQAGVQIQFEMGYHEPPDWYFQLTEAMGDAYLKWAHPEKAVVTYEKALKQYPKNGWVLFGLAKSFRKLGNQQKAKEAELEYQKAWRYADIGSPVALF